MRFIRSALVGATLALSACAPSGPRPEYENIAPRRDRNVLTEEEIVESRATDAYSAVRFTRSAWLLPKVVSTRQLTALVYVDGTRAGGIDVLSQYNTGMIREIRYLSAGEATTRFGTGNGAGAIVVTLKR